MVKNFLQKPDSGKALFALWLPRRTKGDVRLQERELYRSYRLRILSPIQWTALIMLRTASSSGPTYTFCSMVAI